MSEFLDYDETIPTTRETSLYLNQTCAYGVDAVAAMEFAEEMNWSGFALLVNPSSPVPADPGSWSNYYGKFSEYALDKTNWNVIRKTLDATHLNLGGENWTEWEGKIAYNYGSNLMRDAVEDIERALGGYSLLDEDAFSEMEREHAIKYLEDEWSLPDGIDASDVLRVMHDNGHGDDFEGEWGWEDGVKDALDELGCQECAACSTVIRTRIKNALCRDCADAFEPICEGECLSVHIESTYIYGYMTEKQIEAITCECECACGGLCLPCYQEKYPNARLLVDA
jgi:hypothetical protein